MSQLDAQHGATLRTIDPVVLGARLRSARVARGWSQGELAGDLCSVGYLSRIENGTRRPTVRVLTAIAERLEVTVEEVLQGASSAELEEIRLGLRYAELALHNGEALDAERQARQYTERAQAASLTGLAEDGRFLAARAMEALGQLDEAIAELENLLDASTGLAAIRCGVALSRCYREVGDLTLATEVGDRIRPRLEEDGLERSDEAIQLAMTVALAYIERGDLSRASRICTEAIRVAEEVASPTARSAAYWNASIVYSQRGDTTSALTLANRALSLLGEGQDDRNLARLRLELARLQMEVEPTDVTSALEQIERASRALRTTSASSIEVARSDAMRARALLLDGRPDEAVTVAATARAVTPVDSRLGLAEATIVHGEALAATGERDQALAAYHAAARVLTETGGADRWVAQAWCELAALFEAVGELEASRAALKAAASASGLRVQARNGVAATLATRTGAAATHD